MQTKPTALTNLLVNVLEGGFSAIDTPDYAGEQTHIIHFRKGEWWITLETDIAFHEWETSYDELQALVQDGKSCIISAEEYTDMLAHHRSL